MKIQSNFDYFIFYNQNKTGSLTLNQVLTEVLPFLGYKLEFGENDTCNYSLGRYGKFLRSYSNQIYGYGFSICFDPLDLYNEKGQKEPDKDTKLEVYSNPFGVDPEQLLSIKVEFKGEYFKDKTLVDSLNLFVYFSMVCGLYPSRIDYRIDDAHYDIDWEYLGTQALKGNFSGVKKPPTYHGSRFDYQVDGKKKEYFYKNYTFGSRSSRKYLRVYDLFPKHDIRAMRYEVEMKRDAALMAGLGLTWVIANMGFLEDFTSNPFQVKQDFKDLVSSNFDWEKVPARFSVLKEEFLDSNMKINWGKVVDKVSWLPAGWESIKQNSKDLERVVNLCDYYMRSLALGVIDFVDKSSQYSNGSLEKCSRLPEWQKFIDGVLDFDVFKDPTKLPYFAPLRKDIRKTADWLIKQVFFSLSAIRKGLDKVDQYKYGRFITLLTNAEFSKKYPHLDNLKNYNNMVEWIGENSKDFMFYFTHAIQQRVGYPESRKYEL